MFFNITDSITVENGSFAYDINMTNCTLLSPTSSTGGHLKLGQVILICIYGCLSVGILFNCSVVGTIINIFRNMKRLKSLHKHTFLYILTLSLVDTLVLINLPFIVSDMINGWIFGEILCKFHLMTDSINKTLSSFILTALSFDRFLIVCFPHKFRAWRRLKVTGLFIFACCLFAMTLLMPNYIYTAVGPIHVGHKNITKCVYQWSNVHVHLYFIFGFGYCLPFVLMTLFYGSIVAKMWRSSKRTRRPDQRGRGYTRKVTQRTAMLVVFYFACWTPYWAAHFYLDNSNPYENLNYKIVLFHFVHVLAYINSTINPLLYALLNRELRRQCFMAKQKRAPNSDTIELPTSTVAANGRNNNHNVCCQTYPIKNMC